MNVQVPTSAGCKVALIYPRFRAASFWNYQGTCEMMGARYPAPPLGLITVAAMLPKSWQVRLIDRNADTLTDADLDWADLVLTGGMLPQQMDAAEIIRICRARGLPVAVGGPDVTSSPQDYAEADFRILGEAEGVIDDFIAAWQAGARSGTFEAEKFTADVTSTPIPRFDLLKFDRYLHVGVQYSRGCPFTCEFCDIIELYGRVPRTKTNAQMLAELDTIHALGYRGHIDFVDDNFIGNKKSIKQFLPFLIEWQRQHNYPFEFSTEASINLADDEALLALMQEANFFAVFVGIESPDTATLVSMQKKQNTRRSIADSVHTIQANGMFVLAGFILGFDTEKHSVADAMVECVEAAAIPVCTVGLLYALPNTQLTRRLAREGRLYSDAVLAADIGDQCTAGLNFETARARRDILVDYVSVLERVYHPRNYFGRVRRVGRALRVRGGIAGHVSLKDVRQMLRLVFMMAVKRPGMVARFWATLLDCLLRNPGSLKGVIQLMALYAHLGPFSRFVVAQIKQQIAQIDRGEWHAPPCVPVPAGAAPTKRTVLRALVAADAR